MSPPTISFANGLDSSVMVYDSFSDQDPTNYFGTLTVLATVPAKTTSQFPLQHETSVLIVKDATTKEPIARRIYSPVLENVPLGVAQADIDAMKQTQSFITLITTAPADKVASDFKTLWKDATKSHVKLVNDFFKDHQAYASCTFATYMMGITHAAEKPVSKAVAVNQVNPSEQTVYSLRAVLPLLGGAWPPDLPDIEVRNFTCNTQNNALKIKAEVDLDKLPVDGDDAKHFFMSLFQTTKAQVEFDFSYGLDLNIGAARLSITSLNEIKVHCGDMGTLTIKKPTVNIDIMVLLKFVNLTVLGSLNFKAFDKDFDLDVSMTINNLEVSFGMVHRSEISLPGPKALTSVHLDEIGVGIGLIFTPPSAAIGFQGKLHFGELASNVQTSLADSQFAVVCQILEGVPNPLYLSFYVPKLELKEVLKIFLPQHQCNVDVPVSFTDLSFQWCENPLKPVALPDGSLSKIGYGFSATVNVLSFGVHADVSLDLDQGLKADVEIGLLEFGSIFSLKGAGQGYSIKTDADGNPIKNNLLATTAEKQKAMKGAITKQMVAPGGPVLQIQTLAAPYLRLNASVTLFGQTFAVDATIDNDGLHFEVSLSGVLQAKVKCLVSLHKVAASFSLGIDWTIPLPKLLGFDLGSIHLQVSIGVRFSVEITSGHFILTVGASFSFQGMNFDTPDFHLDVNISTLTDLMDKILDHIKSIAGDLFKQLWENATKWAGQVKDKVIEIAGAVSEVLHNAFEQTAEDAAAIMKEVGFDHATITSDLKSVFHFDTVADALKSALGLDMHGVASHMKQVGYGQTDVAQALNKVFSPGVGELATTLSVVYSLQPYQTRELLNAGVGIPLAQISEASRTLGDIVPSIIPDIVVVGVPPPFNPVHSNIGL